MAALGGSGDGDGDPLSWLWGVYREMRSTSRDSLFGYFRGHGKATDLTPDILNLVGRMAKAGFPDHEPGSFAADLEGGADRLDCALAASYLYYTVCEWELARRFPIQPDSAQAARQRRFKGLARVPPNPASRELLTQGDFHAALLHCALEVTAFAVNEDDPGRHYPWMTQRLGRAPMAVSLWAAARAFAGCFAPGSSSRHPMPPAVAGLLERIQSCVMGSTGLAHGSSFHTLATHGGGYCCQEGDPALALEFYSAYATFVTNAGLRAGTALLSPATAAGPAPQMPAPPPTGGMGGNGGAAERHVAPYPLQVATLLDELLLREAGLFLGQPAAVMVGCASYVMAKLHDLEIKFTDVERAVLSALPGTDPSVFELAEVSLAPLRPPLPAPAGLAGGPPGAPVQVVGATAPVFGTMRQFYNTRFLPCAENIARAVSTGAAAQLPPLPPPPTDHPLAASHQHIQLQLQLHGGAPAPAAALATAGAPQPVCPVDSGHGPRAAAASGTDAGERYREVEAPPPRTGQQVKATFKIIPDEEEGPLEGKAGGQAALQVAALPSAQQQQQQQQHSNRLLPLRLSLRGSTKAARGATRIGGSQPPAEPTEAQDRRGARREQHSGATGGGGAAPMDLDRAGADKENAEAATTPNSMQQQQRFLQSGADAGAGAGRFSFGLGGTPGRGSLAFFAAAARGSAAGALVGGGVMRTQQQQQQQHQQQQQQQQHYKQQGTPGRSGTSRMR